MNRCYDDLKVSHFLLTEPYVVELELADCYFLCQDIMTGCLHSEGENISKLEKADILGKIIF